MFYCIREPKSISSNNGYGINSKCLALISLVCTCGIHSKLLAQATALPDSTKVQASSKTTLPKKQIPPPKPKIVLPVPEFINQPYYYDIDANRLIKLENTSAKMNSKKKTLGLGGWKTIFYHGGRLFQNKIHFFKKY